eukprot:TRINITY_DN4050_c0_g1_i1.p1 TRINITY_DN4050_c0_g1~~TRINITY_DN4050_c0_g1_i1.p1  ORF type:complete len:470 (+),score=148.38 TRINITY_DN4050_c0_g1_i1:58-1467(+)
MISQKEVDDLMAKQPNLSKQTYEQIPTLTPLAQSVISRQATLNIGTIGHVAHGKSTVVRAISGIHTVRFHEEKVRNITIKLGYANAKIYKCPKCPAPECFKSFSSSKEDAVKCEREGCGEFLNLIRHISFVDCPGHDILMATMLTGAAVMDAALLLVAADKPCPQPQTSEHLAAVEIMQLNKIIILQNKIDIITKDENAAPKNYEEIRNFIRGTRAENSPIIPISAQLKYNIDAILYYLANYIPIPTRNYNVSPKMIIIRSFDINRPGEEIDNLKGGVVGGSILQGVLKVGDEIEIRPGLLTKDSKGVVKCTPVFSRIGTLQAEQNDLLYAVPGGLIGAGLKVDPALTRANKLVGNVLGHKGQLPEVFFKMEISYFLLRKLLGVKSGLGSANKVRKIEKAEVLMINVGSTSTGCKVESLKGNVLRIELIAPVCSQPGEKIALSRRIDKKWRLIGWGEIIKGISSSHTTD